MKCKTQEEEVRNLINNRVKQIKQHLVKQDVDKAIVLADIYNENVFHGKSVIKIRKLKNDKFSVVAMKKNNIQAIIEKILQDNKKPETYLEQESSKNFSDDLPKKKIAKLSPEEEARLLDNIEDFNDNLDFPDMEDFDLTDEIDKNIPIDKIMEDVQKDMFDTDFSLYEFAQSISNLQNFKLSIESKRNLLINKKILPETAKIQLQQINTINELIKKLYYGIEKLRKNSQTLSKYIDSTNNDIENVKELIRNPTLENLLIAEEYINMIEEMTTNGENGFLNVLFKDLKEGQEKDLISGVVEKISVLRKQIKDHKTDFVIAEIEYHLKQQEKYENWEDHAIKIEARRLYDNQISKEIKDNSFLLSQVTTLSDQEEQNAVLSIVERIYSDSIATNNRKEVREELSNLKEVTVEELGKLGFVKKKLFGENEVNWNIFKQKGAYERLINKYNSAWEKFKKEKDKNIPKMTKLIFDYNKTDAQKALIDKNFKELNDNADFLDVRLIPEIIENEDFAEFKDFFDIEKSKQYKKDLITKIENREYNKLVKEQSFKIYSYQIEIQNLEKKYQAEKKIRLEKSETGVLDATEEERYWNDFVTKSYSKSPFIFADNFAKSGNNKINIPFISNGNENINSHGIADMEYVSYSPKKESFFDKDFKKNIESNPILLKTWEKMVELIEYNNENGFNKKSKSISDYSIAVSEMQISNFPTKLVGLFSKRTLKTLHKAITTKKYVGDKYTVVDSRYVIDDNIEKLAVALSKGEEVSDEHYQEAKALLLEKQNPDLIDNILAATEVTEKFKAKREIETKIKALLDFFKSEVKRDNFQKLLDGFVEDKIYGINNRANWFREDGYSDKSLLSWTKYYSENEKIIRKAYKEQIIELKKDLKKAESEEEVEEIQEEIDSIKVFLESGGKIITLGSIVEFFTLQIPRIGAFALNVSAQTTNIAVANLNAMEVDGRINFWKSGVYTKAKSFSRKWKNVINSKEGKLQRDISEALLNRLGIYQNSANEIFKVEKSKYKNTISNVANNPVELISEVEKMIQRPQILAMLTEVHIKKNNSEETVPVFDAETGTFPAFTLVEGSLKLKKEFDSEHNKNTYLLNNTQEYANLFGDGGKIPKNVAYINGDYRDSSFYLAQKSTIGALGLIFKTWLIATVKKKLGIYKRLGENKQSELAITTTMLKAGIFATAVGAGILPSTILAVSLGIYATVKNPNFQKIELKKQFDELIKTKSMLDIAKAMVIYPTKAGYRAARMAMAVAAASLGNILSITGKPIIDSDMIKKIIKLKEPRQGQHELSERERIEAKEDLYFLVAGAAKTTLYTMLRMGVFLALYPTYDEEEKYKKKVKLGKEKFWERFADSPKVSTYHILENMLTGFTADSNLSVSGKGLLGLISVSTLVNAKDLLMQALESAEDSEKDKTAKGESKILKQLQKSYMPAAMKDGGISLGFGARSKRDFNKEDFLKHFNEYTFDKYEKMRKGFYKKKKEYIKLSPEYLKATSKKEQKSILRRKVKYPKLNYKEHFTNDKLNLEGQNFIMDNWERL